MTDVVVAGDAPGLDRLATGLALDRDVARVGRRAPEHTVAWVPPSHDPLRRAWWLAVQLRAARPKALVVGPGWRRLSRAARRLAGVRSRLLLVADDLPAAPTLGWPTGPGDRLVAPDHGTASRLQAVAAPGVSLTVLPRPLLPEDWPFLATDAPDHPWMAEGGAVVVCLPSRGPAASALVAWASRSPDGPRCVVLAPEPVATAVSEQVAASGLASRLDAVPLPAEPLPWLSAADGVVLAPPAAPALLARALACGRPLVVDHTDRPGREWGGDEVRVARLAESAAWTEALTGLVDAMPPLTDPTPWTPEGAAEAWGRLIDG